MTGSTRTAKDYEKLRTAVLDAEPARGSELSMICNHGMATWLRAPTPEPSSELPCAGQDRIPVGRGDPALSSSELTRLIAGIVVALAAEPAHG